MALGLGIGIVVAIAIGFAGPFRAGLWKRFERST
jgi:hypothetical protein